MSNSNNLFNSADNYQRFNENTNPNYDQDGSSPSEFINIILLSKNHKTNMKIIFKALLTAFFSSMILKKVLECNFPILVYTCQVIKIKKIDICK